MSGAEFAWRDDAPESETPRGLPRLASEIAEMPTRIISWKAYGGWLAQIIWPDGTLHPNLGRGDSRIAAETDVATTWL